jgi:hypothetical protein
MTPSPLYERDFYAWANEQAALLREGRLSETDIEHIAEEVEDLAKRERREFVDALASLFRHLLKWGAQPAKQCESRKSRIAGKRLRAAMFLGESPSLALQINELTVIAYRRARLQATVKTGFAEDRFPAVCPWSFEQVMADDFWPGPAT